MDHVMCVILGPIRFQKRSKSVGARICSQDHASWGPKSAWLRNLAENDNVPIKTSESNHLHSSYLCPCLGDTVIQSGALFASRGSTICMAVHGTLKV
eukprot:771021-Pelagomonas_calceolata.AAC.3